VDRFNLTYAGKSYQSDKNFTMKIDQPGTYPVTIRKIGFNDANIQVTVNASGVNPLYLAGGILLIIIIIWQVWTRFLKQRFAAKKR
jgi:hypothetical protein